MSWRHSSVRAAFIHAAVCNVVPNKRLSTCCSFPSDVCCPTVLATISLCRYGFCNVGEGAKTALSHHLSYCAVLGIFSFLGETDWPATKLRETRELGLAGLHCLVYHIVIGAYLCGLKLLVAKNIVGLYFIVILSSFGILSIALPVQQPAHMCLGRAHNVRLVKTAMLDATSKTSIIFAECC